MGCGLSGWLSDDFAHKLQMALKELRESTYWLRLLGKAGTVPPARLADIQDESNQLRAILSKPVASTKGRAKSPGLCWANI
jgi:four helix bundle protein